MHRLLAAVESLKLGGVFAVQYLSEPGDNTLPFARVAQITKSVPAEAMDYYGSLSAGSCLRLRLRTRENLAPRGSRAMKERPLHHTRICGKYIPE